MYDDVTAALFPAARYRRCYWAVVVGAKGAKDLLVLVVCAQTYYVCMLWFTMSLSPVVLVYSAIRVDSNMESCIESKASGRRPPLVSVCMFSECTVQLLLGVACEACGSRPHCLVLAFNRETYSTLPSRIPP